MDRNDRIKLAEKEIGGHVIDSIEMESGNDLTSNVDRAIANLVLNVIVDMDSSMDPEYRHAMIADIIDAIIQNVPMQD